MNIINQGFIIRTRAVYNCNQALIFSTWMQNLNSIELAEATRRITDKFQFRHVVGTQHCISMDCQCKLSELFLSFWFNSVYMWESSLKEKWWLSVTLLMTTCRLPGSPLFLLLHKQCGGSASHASPSRWATQTKQTNKQKNNWKPVGSINNYTGMITPIFW